MVTDLNGNILFHIDLNRNGEEIISKEVIEPIGQADIIFISKNGNMKYYNAVITVLDIRDQHIANILIGFPTTIISRKAHTLFCILLPLDSFLRACL
jgi:hypothetical protein